LQDAPLRVRYGRSAGVTVDIDRTVKFLSSSPAYDDGCVGGSNAIQIPHSPQAQAGIQRGSKVQ